MKLFDVDWTTILNSLHRFTALPVAARSALLEHLKTHGYAPATLFGPHAAAIGASGIADYDTEKGRLSLHEKHRDLLKVLRAMHRHPVFDQPTVAGLAKYIQEHFTSDEILRRASAGPRGSHVHANAHALAPLAAFEGWTGDLLTTTTDRSLSVWAAAHGLPATGLAVFALADMRRLAKVLVAFPNGVPLADLPTLYQPESLEAACQALRTGIGSLVVFAGLRSSDLEPMIGLWPKAVQELTRPPAPAPAFVTPVEHFALAAQMEDMTTVLATIVAAPVRIRIDDGTVFARSREEMEARLVSPPQWVGNLFVHARYSRVDIAAMALSANRFVDRHNRPGATDLRATKAGIKWLGLSPRDRLAAIIDPIRASKHMNPAGAYNYSGESTFFPYTFPYVQAPKALRLRDDMTRALLLASDGFIVLDHFLDHQSREANPLMALPEPTAADPDGGIYYNGGDRRDSHRMLWRNAVDQFITGRLIPLGAARVGYIAGGKLCFTLTDVGRYLLGKANTFDYGTEDTGDVVIQPNFDIVFLGTAPRTEAALARFAERVGVAPGLTFKITRTSVLAAAEYGATAAEIVEALRSASSKPLPKNVEREIAGWIATVRRGQLRSAELIECADVDSGDRVAALVGPKMRRLAPTVFEIPAHTPSGRAALLKKLRVGGVFLEDTIVPAPRAKKRRQRFKFIDDYPDEE